MCARTRAARPVVRLPMERGANAILMETWSIEVRGEHFEIPAGFESDGASIPSAVQGICGDSMETPRLYAAIWHDACYGRVVRTTRKAADLGYRALLIHFWHVEYVRSGFGRRAGGLYARIHNGLARTMNAVSWIVAGVEYLAIRWFGWTHWKQDDEETEK